MSRDPILGARALRLCAGIWRAVRVQSGYEAAAEILSSPVAVLLVDLRSLGGLHRGLLALARRMEVRLAAIGGETPPDMTGDDLQGLQRIEISDIPAVLASARSSQASRVAGTYEPVGGAALPKAPRASAAEQPAAAHALTSKPAPDYAPSRPTEPASTNPSAPLPAPAPVPARPNAPAPAPAPALASAEAPLGEGKRVMLTPRSGKAKTLTGLLTPEELAFLLEDKR